MAAPAQQRETLTELLAECRERGIRLWIEGDALRYSAPQGVITPVWLGEIRDRKQEILQFLRDAAAAARQSRPPLLPAHTNDETPLSFSQERLWFLDRMGVTGAAYHVPLNLRWRGPLDVAVLQRVLSEIVRRHEPLRTVFDERDGIPRQRILPAAPLALPLDDLRAAPDPHAALRNLVHEENSRAFDLTREESIRARLVILADDEHALLLTLHHIAADGWSLGILLRELGTLYPAFAAGRPSPLSALPVRYTDFAIWQRNWLSGERLESELSYWRSQLEGLKPLDLPLDFPRPPIESFRGESLTFTLQPALAHRLQNLSVKHGATMFMTLLAGFCALLYRYTGQPRIAVGSPIANRVAGELEGLIGLFVNSLVLHTDLTGDPSFSKLLERVRETSLGAYAHQDVPFEKLVQELDPTRDAGRNPLFQVSFALQQPDLLTPGAEAEGAGISPLGQGEMSVRFDLELHLWPAGDTLHGVCSWNADLFRASTIERMMAQYRLLLESAAAHPACPISRLDIDPQPELPTFTHGAPTDPRAARLITELIAHQAAMHPQSAALECDGAVSTFETLHRRALECAHALRAAGAGPETRIALCLDRGPAMAVALLGVLYAGATYVPLDPESPADRLAAILSDCAARFVIADARYRAMVSTAATVLELPDLLGGPALPEPVAVDPDNLAYIIYTSGSTGRPKGAMITHRGLGNYLVWASEYYAAATGDGAPVHSSVAFDLTVTSLLVPLVAGKRVVLLSGGRDVDLLSRSLSEGRGFTLVKLTPAHLELLNHTLAPEKLRTAANALVIGGEALYGRQLAPWRKHGPGVRLINEYGPTETVVGCCVYDVPGDAAPGAVPIGRPIANTSIYILDEHLRQTPAGVPGEIYIGGAGLARGYRNSPAQTALQFIPDPFSSAGARLYRTGDIGRWNDAQQLEYLGRRDRQVKLRGFRVELDEVEAHLSQHPSVRDSAVMIREDAPGDKRLTAYLVPAAAAASDDQIQARVDSWKALFDGHIYRRDLEEPGQQEQIADPLFNTTGWISTYDSRPIPPAELHEWADDIVGAIVGTIAAHRPRRVLEIGCGTGMLLFRIAPLCEHYTGVDLSQSALDYVGEQIAQHPGRFDNVTLQQGAAHDPGLFEPRSFDCIIVNSVVQYFPDVTYLLSVVDGMERLASPGALLFFGDIRNYTLLAAYHTSVQSEQAEPETPAAALAARIERAIAQESELLVDPAFFPALRHRNARFAAAEIRVERGNGLNELTRFRYHALIHLDTPAPLAAQPASLTPDDIPAALSRGPESLCITDIPNLRLAAERRQALAPAGINPEHMHALAGQSGYTVRVTWSRSCSGSFDVLFQKPGSPPLAAPIEQLTEPRPWTAYTNQPLQAGEQAAFIRSVRTHLASRLPHYMVPSSFITLDRLPLTLNGKVDFAALPAPARKAAASPAADAGNALAQSVARIFEDLLAIDTAGPDDGFFHLGGHSLLLTQLAARLRQLTGVSVPLAVLFTAATPSAIARWIEQQSSESKPFTAGPLPDAIVPLQPHGASRPLFLAPPASGTPLCYMGMLQTFDAAQPVFGLQSPAQLSGAWRIEALARHYVAAICTIQPKGPYRIAGWSFGAPVAFEIASQLQNAGETVELLALIDAGVVDMSRVPRALRPLLMPISLVFVILLIAMTTVPRSWADLRRVAQAAGISLPASYKAFFRGGFSSTYRVFRDTLFGMQRALRLAFWNTWAGLNYSPRIYNGRAVLISASSSRNFAQTSRGPQKLDLQKFIPGGFEHRVTPGNHMTMVLDPKNAGLLGQSLRDCLRNLPA